jgi:hypothetical protein
MTYQHIGAWLDKLFFVGFGLYALFASPKRLGKNLSPEETTKRLKIVRICGIVMILCGIGSAILMLS